MSGLRILLVTVAIHTGFVYLMMWWSIRVCCKIQWDTDFIIVLLVFTRHLRLLIFSFSFLHSTVVLWCPCMRRGVFIYYLFKVFLFSLFSCFLRNNIQAYRMTIMNTFERYSLSICMCCDIWSIIIEYWIAILVYTLLGVNFFSDTLKSHASICFSFTCISPSLRYCVHNGVNRCAVGCWFILYFCFLSNVFCCFCFSHASVSVAITVDVDQQLVGVQVSLVCSTKNRL